MKLKLGVLDQAYSDAQAGGAQTTGEVAQILEDKYHVMETFYALNQDKIAGWLADSVQKAIESLALGAPVNALPTMDAEQKIEDEFRDFLDSNAMGTLSFLSEAERDYALAHMPAYTGAASRGVSHRKKQPDAAKNKPRPVFIDTGLYQASFRAWVEK